jgi:hypothetical protein
MRTAVAVLVLALVASTTRADVVPAGGSVPPAAGAIEQVAGKTTRSLVTRSATVDHRVGTAVPVTTRLNPVVGSVQRGHLTNPVTHKSSYRSTVYNPVLGSFGTYKFRR